MYHQGCALVQCNTSSSFTISWLQYPLLFIISFVLSIIMPVKVSNIPGTLAGYDIVLSVSEEAVNAQLQKLYDTPITRGPLPLPTKMKGYAPLPQTQYLINHDFSLHELTKSGAPRKDGIEAHIACPKVRFRAPPESTGAVCHRSAYLELIFRRDESAPEGKKDSVFTFWNTDGDDGPFLDKQVINDYTVTWQVNLGRKHISDVQKDLLDPSTDKGSAITMPDKAATALGNYVDPSLFTVSSIFCMFEESTLVNSFMLRDPSGKPVQSLEDGRLMANLMNSMALYYTTMQKTQKVTGAPTPDNPFVLGYSISEALPDLKDFDENIDESKTPVYFKPRQCDITTTEGERSGNNPITTSGTLNFCMFTHRAGNNDNIQVDQQDLNAGLFRPTFFDKTKTLGKVVFNGKEQGHDGIMAFSKGIFCDHWLKPIGQALLVDYNIYRPMIATAIKEDIGMIRLNANNVEIRELTDSSNRGYEVSRRWHMDDIVKNSNILDGKPYDRRKRVEGECVVRVTYRSNTSQISSLEDGITHARRVWLDIDIKNTLNFHADTRGLHNLCQNECTATDWLNARTMDCRVQSLVVVEINSATAGKWSIAIDREASKNLFKEGQTLEWCDSQQRNDAYGNFDHFENHHTYKVFAKEGSDKAFRDSVQGWKTDTASMVARLLGTAFAESGSTVIMPAGNVFTFAGLDTDHEGHLYCQVNYANVGKVEVAKTKKV
ncbi:hypothetical protein K493DRAFT_409035 [Basidiobolus meristosporus CBS 931.73]|uniref:Uncharacterized protein n=1 Tax=Basidiobolus meristosporus CBS 931.73 TaxID=1314790 RepID=A0A1Y1Y1W3_9FUNG|nr:hypothetical protein K493DRAFT_409035 [Basidiobolus meristosporus CBS 931.73]|eukprot:ORX91991.1 hypothetical protein K493DRAFT_409035 [Basidiobolus meristosporus CBS 931.73]